MNSELKKNSNTVIDKNQKYLLNVFAKQKIVFEYGNGVYLYDSNGKEYIDFVGGIAVNLFGYSDSGLTKTIAEQASKLIHVSNIYYNAPQAELAEILSNNFAENSKVFFANTGTESIEAAIKLARIHSIKTKGALAHKIVAAKNSFHGRTMGALSITGQPKFMQNVGPVLGGVTFINFGDKESLEKAIDKNCAALFLEPIQAEGGIIEADSDYWKLVEKLCKEHSVAFVLDEVQTGMCRTGPLFAHKELPVEPDMITLSKGLGHGVPIGAVVIKNHIAMSIDVGIHGSTLGGNPLACSVGKYVVERLINESFSAKVKKTGEYFKSKLEELKGKHSLVKEVRGRGLLLGVQVDSSLNIADIITTLANEGFLIARAGTDVLRFIPPLIIEEEHIDKLIKALGDFFETLA